MTELSGTLEGVGLPAIVRFLAALQKTGCLRITHQDWHGEIHFDAGQIVSATIGSRKGIAALDALVLALPGASFVFDDKARLAGESNVQLNPDGLQAHLDELAQRTASGGPTLPSLDAVPQIVAQNDDASAEETVPLDRGTLQTLLAIDGKRSVREIIAVRGSFEALWQVGNLAEVGLVRLPRHSESAPKIVEPATRVTRPIEPLARETQRIEPTAPKSPRTREHRPGAPTVVSALSEVAQPDVHCPKLGFEDDPSSSFGRPTRLHRCFAAGAPLPLSLDQQRELCLSDQYGTCPRLAMAGLSPTHSAGEEQPVASAPATPTSSVIEPAPATDPRIVRLPIGGRGPAGSRIAANADTQGTVLERARLHRTTPVAHKTAAGEPTPLRGRPQRGAAATAVVIEPAVPAEPVEPSTPSARVAVAAAASDPRRGLLANLNLPTTTIAAGAMVLMVIAVVAVLLAPHMGALFSDETTVDMSSLPNANAALEGTPVAGLSAARPTAAAAARVGAEPAGAAAAAATTAPAAAPQVQPTTAPQATTAPTTEPRAGAAAQGQASSPSTAAAPSTPRTLLDETFDDNARNWPNNQQGTAWITGGSYRISPRQAGQFVAIGVPAIGEILQDVVVTASFRKVGGPAGGGYGIIVRDQGPAPRDGTNQQGRYYVLEVGDKGEVGIWRREGSNWVDLVPWQRASAVKPGSATNELTVKANGARLSLSVNGEEVAAREDGSLAVGNVGVFVGGDGNQVALDQLSIRTP
ncbi:MAG TPA: DUF4388 domain-containing protein [Chloroflexota bacterium]